MDKTSKQILLRPDKKRTLDSVLQSCALEPKVFFFFIILSQNNIWFSESQAITIVKMEKDL